MQCALDSIVARCIGYPIDVESADAAVTEIFASEQQRLFFPIYYCPLPSQCNCIIVPSIAQPSNASYVPHHPLNAYTLSHSVLQHGHFTSTLVEAVPTRTVRERASHSATRTYVRDPLSEGVGSQRSVALLARANWRNKVTWKECQKTYEGVLDDDI